MKTLVSALVLMLFSVAAHSSEQGGDTLAKLQETVARLEVENARLTAELDRLAQEKQQAEQEAWAAAHPGAAKLKVVAVRQDEKGKQALIMLILGPNVQAPEILAIRRNDHYIVKARADRHVGDMLVCRIIDETWNSDGLQIEQGDEAVASHLLRPEGPGCFAVVTAVETDGAGSLGVVTLSLKKHDGTAAPGMEFLVLRGDSYIVKVAVDAIAGETLICRIVPNTWNSKGLTIMAGDTAQNRF